MTSLNICALGLAPESELAFHSMLGIVSSRSIAQWHASPIEQADVLLARPDSDPSVLSRWSSEGRPLVLVIHERERWPTARHVLRYPFRVMQLLSMLDDVAVAARQAPPPARHGVDAGWAVCESLRQLLGSAGRRGWHVAAGDDGGAIWLGDDHVVTAPDVAAALRAGRFSPGPFLAALKPPPQDGIRLAPSELAWYVGMRSPSGLAPWLAADQRYRLRRWPDFGRLDSATEVIELAALLARRALAPSQLVSASRQAQGDVHRFLAATSLAGLLAAGSASGQKTAPASRTGWSRLVANLCRQLRMVA